MNLTVFASLREEFCVRLGAGKQPALRALGVLSNRYG